MKRKPNRLLTDTVREIRHTFTRFLSLLILSALAVCFLAGLRAAAPDMKLSADQYFDQQKLMDLHILSSLGLTEGDIKALAAQPDILAAQGSYSIDAILTLDARDLVVKVISYEEGSEINVPALQKGRLPQAADECLVEPLLLEETGLSIGDTITLDTGTEPTRTPCPWTRSPSSGWPPLPCTSPSTEGPPPWARERSPPT